MGTVFLFGDEVSQFSVLAHQIPELPDIRSRDKTAGYQTVLENISDPFGVFLVCFLASDCLDVLGVGQNDGAGTLQDVVNRNLILPCGFHAHILTVVSASQTAHRRKSLVNVEKRLLL